MTRTFYGNDIPQIFETIDFINTLLEQGTSAWSNSLARQFNTEI